MTEERFGQIIENTIEGAAQKFDASLERQWKKHKVVRVITKTLSYVICLGLARGAFELRARGYGVAAKICLISGIVGILAGISNYPKYYTNPNPSPTIFKVGEGFGLCAFGIIVKNRCNG